MMVETHRFKEEFVKGDAAGFVVCADLPAAPGDAARRIFAEIYGGVDCYHIFEERADAERQVTRAATGTPRHEALNVEEVRVENIRDYQILAGFKTVLLVDRNGRATQSLRVGDMPLEARTNTPFPGPLPSGVRVIQSKSVPKPPASPPPAASGPAMRSFPLGGPPVRRPMRLVIDPPEAGSRGVGDGRPDSGSSAPGFFARLFAKIAGWF